MTHPSKPCDDFRKLAESLPDGIARYDRAGRLTYRNKAYRRLDPDLRALAVTPTVDGANPAKSTLYDQLRTAIANGTPGAIDLCWQDAAGQTQHVELRATPELNAAGEIDGVLAVARNISKQRETQRQLCLLKFALDHVTEAIYLIDENGRLLHVNDASCRSLGYSYAELMTMSVFDIDSDYSSNDWNQHWQLMLHTGSRTLTSRHQRKDKRLFPVEIRAARFEFDGNIYNFALVQDITEREQAEQAARQRQNEFTTLIENSPDTIARYDRNCRRLYSNASLIRLAGMSAEQMLGQRPSEYNLSNSALAYEKALLTVIASGEADEIEHTWPAADGRTLCSHLIMTPEFAADGQVASVLVIGRDITALKESERRLRQAEAMARLGHWQWEVGGKKVSVSAEMCRIFGKSADWQPKINQVFSMILDEDRKPLLKAYRDACERKETELTLSGYRIRIAKQVEGRPGIMENSPFLL